MSRSRSNIVDLTPPAGSVDEGPSGDRSKPALAPARDHDLRSSGLP